MGEQHMKNSWKWLRYVLIIGGLLSTLTACGAKETSPSADVGAQATMNKGEVAPQFVLNDLKGNSFQLKESQGKKVYVKYWASWCSICLAGLEDLNTLAGQKKDFQIVTIVTPNYKGEKSAKEFTEWFNRQPFSNLTVLLDENGEWAKQFGVRAYPSSFYIGSDSILVKSQPGHADNEQIVETLNGIK